MDIPEELLHPTLEELEERTRNDLAKKRRFRKRLGKKERALARQEKDAEKLKAANAAVSNTPLKPLSDLFEQSAKPAFSLVAASTATPQPPALALPTLRVGLPPKEEEPPVRRRGRPPKLL